MAVTCDPEHKFELAVQLGDLKTAYQLAKEMEVTSLPDHICLLTCICAFATMPSKLGMVMYSDVVLKVRPWP